MFSWDDVVRRTPVERLDHAFTVAKDQLGIERLLDPEGMGSLGTGSCGGYLFVWKQM